MANPPVASSGLARILSNQPLPKVPMFRSLDPKRLASEIEKYVSNLHAYIQNLTGQFTAQNITNTVIQGGTGGFSKTYEKTLHYVGTDATVVLTDTSIDWREYSSITEVRIGSSAANLKNNTATRSVATNSNSATVYPRTLVTNADANIQATLAVSSTGALTVTITNLASPTHKDYYIHVYAAAFGHVDPMAAISIGNGL